MMVIVEGILTLKDNYTVWIREKEKGYKMPALSPLRKMRQEDCKFKTSWDTQSRRKSGRGGEVRGSRKISVHNYLLL